MSESVVLKVFLFRFVTIRTKIEGKVMLKEKFSKFIFVQFILMIIFFITFSGVKHTQGFSGLYLTSWTYSIRIQIIKISVNHIKTKKIKILCFSWVKYEEKKYTRRDKMSWLKVCTNIDTSVYNLNFTFWSF